MSIKVRFFASLAETVGCRETDLESAGQHTVSSAWCEVTGQSSLPDDILCAVNHSYCEHDQVLQDNDEIAYFPPVTGG